MNGIIIIDKPQEWTSNDVVALLQVAVADYTRGTCSLLRANGRAGIGPFLRCAVS